MAFGRRPPADARGRAWTVLRGAALPLAGRAVARLFLTEWLRALAQRATDLELVPALGMAGAGMPSADRPAAFEPIRPIRPIHRMVGDHRMSGGTPAVDFWAALTEAERDAVSALAHERTFAAGAVLFREGEDADHVLVIRDGHTKICVHEDGAERIIAHRGPGQLIGERAALQVSVRSATVISLDTVHALVMTTERFAGFIGAHPRVLGIVEGQVYHRLTERAADRTPSAAGALDGGRPAVTGIPTSQPGATWPGGAGRPRFKGENCTIVFTDIVGFGALHRTGHHRRFVREAAQRATRRAFVAAGIDWESCHCEDRGDGLLIVVPPAVPTASVVKEVAAHLLEELESHNEHANDAARIRLRLAVDVGPVHSDAMGVTGDSIIQAARMIDAPALKQRVAQSNCCLAVAASAFVYDSVVRPGPRALRADGYERIRYKVKESSSTAWIRLGG